jgi:hypothetical protein
MIRFISIFFLIILGFRSKGIDQLNLDLFLGFSVFKSDSVTFWKWLIINMLLS